MTEQYDPFDRSQDLVPQNELQAIQISEIARNGVEALLETSRQMQDNTAKMGQWILASLLAMNSAGAVGVLSAADNVIGPLGTPLVSFGIGAALAVATGINGMVTALRIGPPLGAAIEALRLSALENVIHAPTRKMVENLGPVFRQQLWISAGLAGGSLAAFAFGIYCAVT